MLIFRCPPPSHQMQVSRGRSLLLFSVPVSGDLILCQVIEKLPWIGRLSSSSESRTYISKTPISTWRTSLHSIWHEKNLLFTLTDSLICRIYLVLASQAPSRTSPYLMNCFCEHMKLVSELLVDSRVFSVPKILDASHGSAFTSVAKSGTWAGVVVTQATLNWWGRRWDSHTRLSLSLFSPYMAKWRTHGLQWNLNISGPISKLGPFENTKTIINSFWSVWTYL